MAKKGGSRSGGSNPGWHKPGANGPYHWGNGPQPKGKGCAVTALALAGGVLAAIGGLGYGAIEAAKAVLG